jgi:pimeloyl-ACP methyl ester carboxylesterase
MLATTVRFLSYSPESVALLPLLIHTASSTGDLGPLAAQSIAVGQELSESIGEGMNYSVVCAEDAPFYIAEEAALAGEGSYLGTSLAGGISRICSVWPRGQVPPDYNQQVWSQVPVLLASGEADPVTPPSNAELAARTLPNSVHLIGKGQGHGMIFRGCTPKVAADFIERGSVQGLDSACIQDLPATPFFTSFTGPQP